MIEFSFSFFLIIYVNLGRLYKVPERPVISNCGTCTENASECLDNHLKPTGFKLTFQT